jgi:hypothetical protein
MDGAQAISLVTERIQSQGLPYPVDDLRAEQFYGGWCVYSPDVIADEEDEEEDPDIPVTRSVFLVGESGRVEEVTSDEPADAAREWFKEACIWFSAEEPGIDQLNATLPSSPELGGRRPRPPADYDREAVDVLARALTQERDFGDWLAGRLKDLADLLGGSSRLTARRPRSWAASHLSEFTELMAEDEGRPGVWPTWPPVDPATLPDVDPSGWVLVPVVRTVDYLEGLEAETPVATRLADAIAERANQAPPWRACGVAELLPQLAAVHRTEALDADLETLRKLIAEETDEDVIGMLLVPPSPDNPDVDALLRLAIHAEQQQRKAIDIGAAATAAYRRLLDRLDLVFENYAYEAMFDA